jgi:flagellar hook-associated protein FlgK
MQYLIILGSAQMIEKPQTNPFNEAQAIAKSIRRWGDYLEHASKNECESDMKECIKQINELTQQIRRL